MRILALCDDIWHPAQVVQDGLLGLEKHGFEFDFITNAREWSSERMAEYPLVILAKANNISAADETPWMIPEVAQVFQEYVQTGNGLLAIHSGTAGYADTLVLRRVLGGVFREHPEQCEVTIKSVVGAQYIAPLPSNEFSIMDEHYFMELDDDQATVFMTTTSEHGTQPGGWTRMEGDGRVCVLTPGHNLAVWEQPVYQDLIEQAINWAGNL